MPTINDDKKIKVTELYKKGHSARQIAEHLGVSINAVYYALRRFSIKRRSVKENNALLFEKKPPSFNVKRNLDTDDEILKALGVALYWGEGYKSEKGQGVDFANSDARMVKIFLHFLREICGVKEDRLRVYLYCHSKRDVPRLISYWSSVTAISPSQFNKPYISKRASKKGKGMPYGLIHVRYSDKKLLILIRSWIGEYAGFRVGTQVVNEGGL